MRQHSRLFKRLFAIRLKTRTVWPVETAIRLQSFDVMSRPSSWIRGSSPTKVECSDRDAIARLYFAVVAIASANKDRESIVRVNVYGAELSQRPLGEKNIICGPSEKLEMLAPPSRLAIIDTAGVVEGLEMLRPPNRPSGHAAPAGPRAEPAH